MALHPLVLEPTPEGLESALPILSALAETSPADTHENPALAPCYVPQPPSATGGALPLPAHAELAPGTRLLAATSGTTGAPKYARLSGANLASSALATTHFLGGDGAWLLALPPHHIAGLQVILRSLRSGYLPELQSLEQGFSLDAFVKASERLLTRYPQTRHYTSLVPIQLYKIMHGEGALGQAARDALTYYHAILVGGGPADPMLLSAARDLGAHIVTTYGASETAGGCVYNGLPLPCTDVTLAEDGRILLGGDTVAAGYYGQPDHPAWQLDGWFRTDDYGHWNSEGHLVVDGRLDNAISSGGLTVFPSVVEQALLTHPDIAQAAVLGLPDPRLGEAVAAVLVLRPGADSALAPSNLASSARASSAWADQHTALATLRETVKAAGVDAHAAPRVVFLRDDLPQRGIGKLDRKALRASILAGTTASDTVTASTTASDTAASSAASDGPQENV